LRGAFPARHCRGESKPRARRKGERPGNFRGDPEGRRTEPWCPESTNRRYGDGNSPALGQGIEEPVIEAGLKLKFSAENVFNKLEPEDVPRQRDVGRRDLSEQRPLCGGGPEVGFG